VILRGEGGPPGLIRATLPSRELLGRFRSGASARSSCERVPTRRRPAHELAAELRLELLRTHLVVAIGSEGTRLGANAGRLRGKELREAIPIEDGRSGLERCGAAAQRRLWLVADSALSSGAKAGPPLLDGRDVGRLLRSNGHAVNPRRLGSTCQRTRLSVGRGCAQSRHGISVVSGIVSSRTRSNVHRDSASSPLAAKAADASSPDDAILRARSPRGTCSGPAAPPISCRRGRDTFGPATVHGESAATVENDTTYFSFGRPTRTLGVAERHSSTGLVWHQVRA
jgi:hypothetical protein